MNTNRLALKDYIIIYLIIFLIVAFLGGFFLGAKKMESELQKSEIVAVDNTTEVVYKKDEIINFYERIFAPIIEWNKDIYNIIDLDMTFDEAKVEYLINNGEFIESNIGIYTFESEYLMEAATNLKDSLNITLDALKLNNPELLPVAFDKYLTSQKYFYQGIWAWEQTAQKNNEKTISDASISWNEWNKASLHEKNYIVALILENNSIHTFLRPEDITVHIDAYAKSGDKELISISDMVNLLITSLAIQEKDFVKYKENYTDAILPGIPNFN